MISDEFKEIRLIANNDNYGFAKANNQAIKKASGEFVLLLNPDTEIKDGAIDKTIEFMKKETTAGITGCHLIYPNNAHQDSVRGFPGLISTILVILKLHRVLPFCGSIKKYFAKDFDYKKTQIVDQVMGAFFMVRRKVFDQIGLLDDGFYIWLEEVDFCFRAINKGWKVFYFAEAEIIHHYGQSFGQVFKYKKQKMLNRSLLRYFKKHHPKYKYVIVNIFRPFSLLISLLVQLLIKSK